MTGDDEQSVAVGPQPILAEPDIFVGQARRLQARAAKIGFNPGARRGNVAQHLFRLELAREADPRVAVCDISQGGMKIKCKTVLPVGADVVVSLSGLSTQPGVTRWNNQGHTGITFNRLLPLSELVGWLQDQRAILRAASYGDV